MMRGIARDGTVVIGLTRSSLEHLQAGATLTSPAYHGNGPAVVLVFAETDEELSIVLRNGDRGAIIVPGAQETDLREKRGRA